MRYQISGKQIDIGSALQQHVKAEIDGVASKYAERPTDAVVVFSKSGHEFVCEATIHLSTGLTAQAKAHDNEIYASFDNCAEKMEKQLRRYKRRLKDHHTARTTPVELSSASSYILAPEHENEESELGSLQPTGPYHAAHVFYWMLPPLPSQHQDEANYKVPFTQLFLKIPIFLLWL